jgi:hypothetical protein
VNRDFAEMLSALSAEGADYLVVGAYALAAHGFPRATGDLDLWVRPTRDNARRVLRALATFGAPVGDLAEEDLARPGTVFQIGVAPNRIDLMTSVDGVEFDEAWDARTTHRFGGRETAVLARAHLLKNKRATDRPRDRLDAEWLERGPD